MAFPYKASRGPLPGILSSPARSLLLDDYLTARPPLHPLLWSAPATDPGTGVCLHRCRVISTWGGRGGDDARPHSCIPRPSSGDLAEEGLEIAKDSWMGVGGRSTSRVLAC